jgi:hypothetical protein
MRVCAELADLAMQLARAAAARTLADWAEPENPPAATPHPAQSARPQIAPQAEPHADHETAPHADPAHRTPAAAKQTAPAIIFIRLAAVVRDCMALEARLAAAAPTSAPEIRTKIPRADPRRVPVRETIRLSTANHPDSAEINRKAAARLDERLAADPDQTIAPGDLLDALCGELGIKINYATLPTEYLNALCGPPSEGHPDPHATYPP